MPKPTWSRYSARSTCCNLLPRGTHDYTRFLKPAELARLCRKAGLEVLEITGLRYNPFTREGVVGADTDINYLLRARRSA
jgi:2-polyprenyl-6-hydroxyphenyl methylase/3-demethylubiquinone-9 3-methyltransferase